MCLARLVGFGVISFCVSGFKTAKRALNLEIICVVHKRMVPVKAKVVPTINCCNFFVLK